MQRFPWTWLIVGAVGISLFSAFAGAWFQQHVFAQPRYVHLDAQPTAQPGTRPYADGASISGLPDFATATAHALPAVVHITARYNGVGSGDRGFFSHPFEEDAAPRGEASGSGVLISEDGYIATNNHVIEEANEVTITLYDNRVYSGTVVGVDYNTDLALVKIEDTNLPHLKFGESDELKIGEWVLAMGNPMDLTSTVTAGIVSAKGRNINLLAGERNTDAGLTIESFIQTDAAVNRGNSGGALVNNRGQLVGINTAIASRTGSYAGYAFAIPSSLVRKVMADLLTYGSVQRGFLGVSIQPITAELAQRFDLPVLKGAYISNVRRESAADEAGLLTGDVIVSVQSLVVSNTSELQEIVSRYRPGDKLAVTFYREGESRDAVVTLKGALGELVASSSTDSPNLAPEPQEEDEVFRMGGASFRNLDKDAQDLYGLQSGVWVVSTGPSLAAAGIPDGFVLTHIGAVTIPDIETLERVLTDIRGEIEMKGYIHPGAYARYRFAWK